MGRLRTAAIECNYQEIDRQLKEQFIHRLNDQEMLAQIIRELTKSPMVVVSSLHEIEDFDAIMYKDGKLRETGPGTSLTTSTRRRCKYYSQALK